MPVMPNSSVFHNVPIKLQPQSWACWYTSFQMVVAYERGRGRGGALKDPSEVGWIKAIYDGNKGIGATSDEREMVAKALGFQVMFASMSADGIWDILQNVPIIYAGRWPGRSFGHFVVLVGISETKIAINNPATAMETYDYNWFAGQMLLQTEERPLIYPPA
jgi:ABC-type bacteriocin/lantibiotic exporter with double-glycine peptidase domain